MAQLPINDFITERLKEYDPDFELRSGTAFESMFIKPVQFITQPLYDEMSSVFTGQSFSRILSTSDPDAYSEEAVDSLASNFYVYRREGATSSGIVRIYYNDPDTYEYPSGTITVTSEDGLEYVNTSPFFIDKNVMSLNIQDGLYYFDVPMTSVDSGLDTEVEIGGIVSLENDNFYVKVNNLVPFTGGLDRETNTELITRTRNSIGVRDLLTGKGFNAILFENFNSFLSEIMPIGFGDDEMMRDIVYNTHVGGKVDTYVKTSTILQGSYDIQGLGVDETRQTYASKNCIMVGTAWTDVGNPNIDRSSGKAPVVIEIKDATYAQYTSTVDMSSPIDLSANQYVKIGIDGVIKDVRVAGVVPSATTRNEILNLINYAFGVNVASVTGSSLKVKSPTYGLSSSVLLGNPTIGTSALALVFGLPIIGAPYTYVGDGPVTFYEGVHYEMDDGNGNIRRIIGSTVLLTQVTGRTTLNSTTFTDLTPGIFSGVAVRDIVTISSGPDAGDYRVLEWLDDNNLELDTELTTTALGVSYNITRTGIKSNETIYLTYYYNPLSVDIGKYIRLDQYGRVRGIRPGREATTITDLALLRINYIEEIDPLSLEPTGYILDDSGGFGQGGFGQGGFGRGAGSDWTLIVNSPTERFSMFEDSYVVFQPSMVALSFRIHYDYVPEISQLHDFCRSEEERILDGDILIKHFLPAYVSGTIQYTIIPSLASVAPTNAELQELVKGYINSIIATEPLEYSNVIQFIARTLDPSDRYGLFIKPFTMTAVIHNTNATTSMITGDAQLVIPTLDPFPIETDHPLSPKIAHWVADNIVMERL